MIVDCGGPIAAANDDDDDDDDDRGLISLPGRSHQLAEQRKGWRWQRTVIGSPAPILWIVLDPRLVDKMMMMMMLLAPVGRDRDKTVPELYVVVPLPLPFPSPSPTRESMSFKLQSGQDLGSSECE